MSGKPEKAKQTAERGRKKLRKTGKGKEKLWKTGEGPPITGPHYKQYKSTKYSHLQRVLPFFGHRCLCTVGSYTPLSVCENA